MKATSLLYRLNSTLTWKVLVNTGWASAATPVTIGLGILQIGMMARILGPEGIGVITLFGAVCTLFDSLLKFTSSETVMVYASKGKAIDSNVPTGHIIRYCYFLDFLTSFVAFSAVVISSLFLPHLFNLPPGVEWLLALFGLTIVFQSAYWTSHGLLRIANRFSWTFYHSVAHSILKTSMVAVLFLCNAGLVEVVYLLVGLSLLNGTSLYVMANLALKKEGIELVGNGLPWWQVPREVWRFQILGHMRQIVKSMSRYIDTITIGYISNPVQVGFYRVSKQTSEQIRTPAQGFLVSLFPEYCRLYFSGDMSQFRRLVKNFTILLLGLAFMGGLILWFGAELIIRVVFGEEFLHAKDVVRILIISSCLMLTMYPLYSLPAAVGKAGPALKAVIGAIIVQVIMIYLLVPKQGALGAAWANVAYVVTWALLLLPSIVHVLSNTGSTSMIPKAEPEELFPMKAETDIS